MSLKKIIPKKEQVFGATLFHFVKRAAFTLGLVCLLPIFANFFIAVPALIAWVIIGVIGATALTLAGLMAFMDGLTHGGIR